MKRPHFNNYKYYTSHLGDLEKYADHLEEELQLLRKGIKFIDSKLGKNQWPAKRKIKELLNQKEDE